MGHVAQRHRDQWLHLGRLDGGEDVGMAGEGPDPHAAPGSSLSRVDADVVEVGEGVDVDEHRRCGQTHGQQRDQGLAAGQHLRPLLPRERREGFLEGGGAQEGEGGGLHRGVEPPEAASSTPPS